MNLNRLVAPDADSLTEGQLCETGEDPLRQLNFAEVLGHWHTCSGVCLLFWQRPVRKTS